MRKYSFWERLIAVCCTLAILLSFPFAPVSAATETGVKVTASTNASVKQGNSAYCYVYIDSMESLSTLEVTVHFDPAVVQLTGSYNQVDALVYDSGSTESTLQYTYIFDGNGKNSQTQLFYFQYTVKSKAPVGETYFDIVVGDAFDASFNTLPVSGSRCAFTVTQTVTSLSCTVRGTSSVSTAVNGEFTLSYSFSTTAIASGSVVIRYDPELFAVSEVTQGGFLTDKMTDINTTLSGAVYLSFLGAQYGNNSQLLTLRFKTLKNVTQTSSITMQVSDLYDLQLNPITCSGYTTSAKITYDPTVDENAPYVFLEQDYDAQNQNLTIRVCLEENSHLGAGDFVLQFDTQRLLYKSAEKGYRPTFFNINDKNVAEGLLKFSVISMQDMTEEVTMLSATFQVLTPCENTPTQLQISGSGLANYLTAPIVLNFNGCTVETAGHTVVTDPAVAPDCLNTGLTEGSHCAVCAQILVAQNVVDALGHDEIPHEALAPTCTEIGWEAYVTCSRCDYTTYMEIPANGHTFHRGVCTVCAAAQEAGKSWDISAAGDGSLTAELYLNADGTYDLQITGSGLMLDWSGSSSVPWYSYRKSITGVRLPEGLENVGSYAFCECVALTEVTIPEKMKTLGGYAFYNCIGLTAVNLPEGLTDIGSYIFSGCTGLTTVNLSEGLNTIGSYAFSNCSGLTAIKLPDSLVSIGIYAFQNCTGLKEVNLPRDLQSIGNYAFYNCTALCSVQLDAVRLADKEYDDQVFAYGGQKGDGITVAVGSGVTRIPAYLFCPYTVNSDYAAKVTEVTFAENSTCESIGQGAFYGCKNLAQIQFSDSVTRIEGHAFNGCSSLTEITLPENLTVLQGSAFYRCLNLTRIHFNAAQLGNFSKDNYIFSYCGQSGDGITVTVGAAVTRLPQYLFKPAERYPEYTPKITAVEFAENSVCQYIGGSAFYGCSQLTEIELPEGVQTVGSYAFYNCTGLTRIHFNAAQMADLSSSNYVFAYAGQSGDGITVTVGSGVTRIPAYLFYPYSSAGYIPKITAVEFAENSVCESIGSCAFYNCTGLTEIILPDSLTTIGSSAFRGCTGLTEITLAENLTAIGNAAFYNCTGLTRIHFNAAQMADLSSSNYVFSYAGQSGDGITVTVGSGVTKIPAYLFYPYSSANHLPKITAVEFAENSVCESIGSYAFNGNTQLTGIILPKSLQSIGSAAFAGCSKLTIGFEAETLPESLGSNWRGDCLYFLGSPRIVTVADATYVIQSADRAVLSRYYGSATTFSVESRVADVPVVEICDNVFRSNSKLTTVILPEGLTTIGNYAFEYCSALTEINFPQGLTTIGRYAFRENTGLTAVNLPEGVQTVDTAAFYGCTALTEVTVAAGLQNVGYEVFYGCTSLQSVSLPEGLRVIDSEAFYNCTALAEINFPASVQSIGYSAFYNCTALTEITLPEHLTFMGESAFYNCTAVTRINFNATNMSDLDTYYGCFANCGKDGAGITLMVGSAVTRIPAYLCYQESQPIKLNMVEFAEDSICTAIGRYAFCNSTELTEITLPESLTSLGEYAFYNCSGLTQIHFKAAQLENRNSSNAVFAGCGHAGDGIKVIVGSNVTRLPEYLFYESDASQVAKITEVEFAENSACTEIGNYAFYNCTTLRAINLPKKMESIGTSAFYKCIALTEITWPENLKTLSSFAFHSCEGIQKVVLPEGMTEIGTYTFYNCTGLTELTLPQSLSTIGAYAFYGCSALQAAELSDSITTIGSYAFCGCAGLSEITLPLNLTSLGSYAFSGCTGLTKIRIYAAELPDLSSSANCFHRCGQNGDGITVTVGSGVTQIPNYLFYSGNSDVANRIKLSAVEFEADSVCYRIGNYAFYQCTYLKELCLPESLETVGSYAFYNCSKVKYLEMPSAISVGEYAFAYNYSMETASLPENLTSLGNYAFYNCTALTEIRFDAVQLANLSNGNYVFAYCGTAGSGMTLTVGNKVKSLPSYLMCPYEYNVTYTPLLVAVEFEPGSVLESICSYAFYNNRYLERICIPATVQNIENRAFAGCAKLCIGLEAEKLPETLGYLWNGDKPYVLGASRIIKLREGNYAIMADGRAELISYYGSEAVFEVAATVEDLPVTAIRTSAFAGNTKLTEIILPESLTTIGSSAFSGCTGLTEITLVENLTAIGNYAFYNCTGLTRINFNAVRLADLSSGNFVFSYAGQSGDGITVTVGSGVTKIPAYLFCPYGNVSYLPKIIAVEFAENSLCESIGSYAFYKCTDLTEVILPESLTTIGSSAFSGCTGLTEITLPENLTTLGSSAFSGCTGLSEIALAENLTTIGNSAFYNCTGLNRINFNAIQMDDLNGDNFVFACAGQSGDGITVTVGSGVTKIPAYLFYPYGDVSYLPKIIAVEFAENGVCESIGSCAFYNCTDLTEIRLPESLTTIDSSAFYGCTGLEKITLPESLTMIGSSAFSGCTELSEIALPENLTTIGNAAFYNCTGLTRINFNAARLAHLSSSNYVFAYAGQSGDGITVTVGSGVTRIPAYLFYPYSSAGYIPKITAVEFAENGVCESIGSCAFYNCTGITEVILPASVQTIGGSAFYNCANLTKASVLSSAVAEKITSADAAGYLTNYAQTVLLPGTLQLGSYLQNKYANREQIVQDGVTYWLLDQNTHSWQVTQTLIDRIPCQRAGLVRYTCDRCNTYKDVTVEKHTIVYHEAKEPDCETVGWDSYETCTECAYTTYVEIPARGHWVINVTEKNDPLYPFEFNGTVYASSNHLDNTTSVYTITAIRDCTMVFFGKVSSEGNYDKLILRHNNTVIKELSGQLDWQQYTLTLKAEDVVTVSYRKDGSASAYQDTAWFRYELAEDDRIPAQDDQPTCLGAVVCSLCGEVQKEALGHDPVYSHTQQPTCMEVGYDIYQCTRCDYTEKYEIAALGHDPVYSHTQQPTCLEVGYDIYRCTRCDYTEKHEVAALGHDPVAHEAKEQNCTEIGWDAYETCARCDYTTYKEIPANGHSFVQTFCTACSVKQTPLNTWDASAVADGSLTARLYKNYVDGGYELEITGSGAMADYSYSSMPWYSYRGYINRVSLPEGLTYIGSCAFQYFDSLRLIRIPDSVERISSSAFDYSKNMIIVFEGNNASLAPSYGWYGCGYYFDPQKVILEADATYVIDKDGNAVLAKYIGTDSEFVARETVDGIPVTRIGRYAFYQRTNLKTYWIPNGIQEIDANAFSNCNGLALLLENSRLPATLGSSWNGSSPYYLEAQLWTENDILFVKDSSDRVDVLDYLGDGEEVIVPAQPGGYPLTRIRDYAFYGNNVKRVILPEGITSVGTYAFSECIKLQEIQLPQSLTAIGVYAFGFCTALREIYLPENLTTLGSQAFWYCSSLQEIVIPDGITQLESSIFCGCSALKKVTLPDSIKTISHMVFYSCSSLSEINLPQSLVSMSSDVFNGCRSLQSIELPENLHSLTASGIFSGCSKLKVVYVRSPKLAATLTNVGAASMAIQNAVTVVVPTGTGTDYLKSTYAYCETRERKGMAVDVYSSCTHDWQTETVTEYVHCQQDGYWVYTCAVCNAQTDTYTPRHTYEESTVAPNCTEDGYTLHTCPDCGESYKTAQVEKLGHDANQETFMCNRCGQEAYLLLLSDSTGIRGFNTWEQAMSAAAHGSTLQLRQNISGDVSASKTLYLDLNGCRIDGTLILEKGTTVYGLDTANDDFNGCGSIGSISGDGLLATDVMLSDGKRYIALTDENGISFHRLQLRLHTVSLRAAEAGIYYRATIDCDDALRNAISYHGVALSVECMPGVDFMENSQYSRIKGAPIGDFTSVSVFNIFRKDLSAAENATRGAMKIYANVYLQLADGTVLLSDTTTGDQATAQNFDGVAYSLFDVMQLLDTCYPQLTATEQQNVSQFYTAWQEKGMQDLQLENIATED